MSEWINVRDRIPREYEPVWIFWRDREVVIGWKTYYFGLPQEYWYSYEGGDKERWTNWWMPIDLKNRPKPPEIKND